MIAYLELHCLVLIRHIFADSFTTVNLPPCFNCDVENDLNHLPLARAHNPKACQNAKIVPNGVFVIFAFKNISETRGQRSRSRSEIHGTLDIDHFIIYYTFSIYYTFKNVFEKQTNRVLYKGRG